MERVQGGDASGLDPLLVQLGVGRKPRAGWFSIDILFRHHPDVVADLSQSWPLSDASVQRYHVEHVLEHLPDTGFFMGELWRTLRPGGEAEITVPHARSPFAVADPTHLRFFNGLTLDFYVCEGRGRKLAPTYDHDLRLFELVSRSYTFGWALRLPVARLLGIQALATRFPLAYEKWWSWVPLGGCDVTWRLRKPSP